MKTTFAASAALLSAASASSVTLQTTDCLSANVPIEQFEIELNTQDAVPKELTSVCGLEIISASPDWVLKDIKCQAFKDTAGTVPGSAVFTYDEPAAIATNPVQEQSILCFVSVTPDETLKRRQVFPSSLVDDLTTATAIPTDVLSSVLASVSDLVGTPSPRPAASSSSTTDDEAESSTTTSDSNSAVTSTVVITSTASRSGPSGFVTATGVSSLASSGFPSSTNGTALSTSRPTPTQSSNAPSETTNAAGQAAVGLGVVAAAFAALVL